MLAIFLVACAFGIVAVIQFTWILDSKSWQPLAFRGVTSLGCLASAVFLLLQAFQPPTGQ